MVTTKEKLLTADDLLRLDAQGMRGELIRGVLCETTPTGGEHGEIVMNIGILLGNFIGPLRLGRLAGSDAGVRLERDPDTVREPDVAYISAERLPLTVKSKGYYEVVPELVVEIVSPSDSWQSVHDKALMWTRYGSKLVWVVYPDLSMVDVYSMDGEMVTLGEDDVLDGGDVLPGFSCYVSEVFSI